MIIKQIKPFLVDRFLLVRVYTDQGIVGNGEAGLWAHQQTVYHAIQELSAYYIGQDPTRIEHHYQAVSRNTHFMGSVLSAAMSAIDVALWDILGKSVGLPVYQLLGGKCRNKIKVFNNVSGNTLADRAENAVQNVAAGFSSLRTTPFFPNWQHQNSTQVITSAIEIVDTIRQAIGYDVDLGLEIHRNLSPNDAIILANELAPFRILYYEDPLAPQSIDALGYVAQHCNIPIATGERFYSLQQFKELIDRKTVSLIRPDVSLAGGFTQNKKISALAEANFIGVFPHLMGSPVNTAAFAQLVTSIPNYVLMESNLGSEVFNQIVDQPVKREGGYLQVSDRPGIGLEIDESQLDKFPFQPRQITENVSSDGSIAH